MAFIACLAITGCHDDEDKGKTIQIRGTIVGDWLNDQSNGNTKLFAVNSYHEDGTVEQCLVWINKAQNTYDFSNGTYRCDNITYTEYYDNNNTSFDVQYMDGYSMIISNSDLGVFETMNRIVNTYDMVVGEEQLYVIEDMDFVPTEYVSTDPVIASVDDSGLIHAVKQGMAFIKATSSLGTAVIRVNVTDPHNIIDDFASYMGASIEVIKNIYGTDYIDLYNGTTAERNYNIYDKYVEHAVFSYFARTVQNISIDLREYADIEAILGSYRQKYDSYLNSKQMFKTTVNGKNVLILVYPSDYRISFVYEKEQQGSDDDNYSDSSYQQFEDLINMTATQAAERLNHEMTDEEWEDGFFDVDVDDNEIFENVSVMFDQDEDPFEVETVIMQCKRGITQEKIEPWYKEHYQATGDEINPYCSEGESFYIRFKQSGSRLSVYYSKRKARK